jgi:DivIVA domain-containing protein
MLGISAAEVCSVQPRRGPWGMRGYAPAEVDAFLVRAADALAALEGGPTATVTADEVHHVVFRKPSFGAGRGYAEDAVDELLDRIEHTLRAGRAWPTSDAVMLNGRPIDE